MAKKSVKIKVDRNKRRIRHSSLSYREMKKLAVTLGMPFPDACSGDINDLMGYINKTDNKPDKSLIEKYDQWMDQQLANLGYKEDDPMRHFQLRLGYISDEMNEIKQTTKMNAKPKKVKEKKEKVVREVDAHGLWKGTKKSLTFECASSGMSLEKTIKKVLKQFPDAKEVSIKQWYKRATK